MYVEETEQGLRRELIRCIKLGEVEDAIALVDRLVELRVEASTSSLHAELSLARASIAEEARKRGAREQEAEMVKAREAQTGEKLREAIRRIDGFMPLDADDSRTWWVSKRANGDLHVRYGLVDAAGNPVADWGARLYYQPDELEAALAEAEATDPEEEG